MKKKNNISNVLFSDYRVGSLYAFHTGRVDIDVFMKNRDTQFDYWRKKISEKPPLKKSIIVVDTQFPINNKFEELFKRIEFVKNIEVKQGSVFIKTYKLYIANN